MEQTEMSEPEISDPLDLPIVLTIEFILLFWSTYDYFLNICLVFSL